MKKISIVITVFIMLFAVSITVYANSSPTADFSTDSSDILVAEADTSIPAIKKLISGSLPKDVVGDESLDGYSTLGVFSVSAVGDYDFSETVATDIRTAGLTSDMTVKVKLLDTSNQWSDVSHTISNGVVSAVLRKEGQVAIFVLDSVDITNPGGDTTEPTTQEQTEDKPQDEKKLGGSPKTGDAIFLFGAVAFLSMGGILISLKKLR